MDDRYDPFDFEYVEQPGETATTPDRRKTPRGWQPPSSETSEAETARRVEFEMDAPPASETPASAPAGHDAPERPATPPSPPAPELASTAPEEPRAPAGASIVVEVDEDLEDLVPDFMQNRRNEIERMTYALKAGDFSTIQAGGHVMKGSGGGYGFDYVSEVGAELEDMAKASDAQGIRGRLEALRDYLDRVEVVFV